ncbi:MAG TPA: D-alanine--D-alanine ligase family protein, partial [Caldilineaceae bacterium]|nr:D-alanine--D-alanine ligase family protein [Caldilineaceae bacterium]
GHWLTANDPLKQLTERAANPALAYYGGAANGAQPAPSDSASWALLPTAAQEERLPAIDVIFPVLHGPYGEDGAIQGLLEMANLPYVGCGVLGSALAMDKAVAKRLFAAEGLPQAKYHLIHRAAWQASPEAAYVEVEARLAYPLFVKPANLGSSVGVSKARNRRELAEAVALAAAYDRKIVVEEAVPNAREIEVSVLGNDDPIASVPGEIIPGHEFYDYAAKYLDDSSQLLIPAALNEEQTALVREMAVRAFKAVDGAGLARVDFLMDGVQGKLYLNEINTMPGFTRISMYPKLWEASGISYPELVDRLVQLALERYQDRQQNRTTR